MGRLLAGLMRRLSAEQHDEGIAEARRPGKDVYRQLLQQARPYPSASLDPDSDCELCSSGCPVEAGEIVALCGLGLRLCADNLARRLQMAQTCIRAAQPLRSIYIYVSAAGVPHVALSALASFRVVVSVRKSTVVIMIWMAGWRLRSALNPDAHRVQSQYINKELLNKQSYPIPKFSFVEFVFYSKRQVIPKI